MDALESAEPGLGHNNPPTPTLAEAWRDRIALDPAFVALKASLADAAAKAKAVTVVDDDDDYKNAADAIALSTKVFKAASTMRVAEKEPFLTAERMVDGVFGSIVEDMVEATKVVRAAGDRYTQEKVARERAILEENARKAREAEDKARHEAETAKRNVAAKEAVSQVATQTAIMAEQAAAVKPAEIARVRSESGSMATARTETKITVDRDTLDLDKLRPYIALDALEKAAKAAHKAGLKNIAGVTVSEVPKMAVRG